MTGEECQDPIIRVFHVHKQYGARRALSDITFDVCRNEFLFISGPSGAGKTTLLKLMYLGEEVTAGHILVNGVNLSRLSRKKIPYFRRKFGIVFQDYKLIPTLTVYDNIALVLEAVGKNRRWIPKIVHGMLKVVGMEDKSDAYPPSLSGGEQQRAAVARAVAPSPEIILADEPTGNLDAESAKLILALLTKFYLRGATVIIATHDLDMIRKKGGRMVYLQNGAVNKIFMIEPSSDCVL
jgi:cell division transport system ATP-binding protein